MINVPIFAEASPLGPVAVFAAASEQEAPIADQNDGLPVGAEVIGLPRGTG